MSNPNPRRQLAICRGCRRLEELLSMEGSYFWRCRDERPFEQYCKPHYFERRCIGLNCERLMEYIVLSQEKTKP